MKFIKYIVPFFLFAIFFGCSSNQKKELNTAEEIFNKGLEYFKDEDYMEANKLFEVIKLQYPASQYSDDAQYYIGEIAFKRKEYITAAFQYNMLYRTYPRSEYAKISLYKAAECYYNLSPDAERDQDYTTKAIASFSTFQAFYPTDSLSKIATNRIIELRNKLAERNFNIAKLYRKLFSPNSAVIYYDELINSFPDTKYYELAFIGKIESLLEMKKFFEAKSIIDVYKKNFPSGSKIDYYKTLENNLPK